MSKSKYVIGLGALLLLMGLLLCGSIFVRFIPILGGDSVLPNALHIASKFTCWDYLRIFLGAGFYYSGLVILLVGITLILKKN
jgi:hypothetical protein